MGTDVLEDFEDSLGGLGVTWSRTTAAEFEDALDDAIVAPAVGTPLPFDGVSLADADVTQDPTPVELDEAATGVTPAAFAIAD